MSFHASATRRGGLHEALAGDEQRAEAASGGGRARLRLGPAGTGLLGGRRGGAGKLPHSCKRDGSVRGLVDGTGWAPGRGRRHGDMQHVAEIDMLVSWLQAMRRHSHH